jgi:hypothetical protein
MEVAVEAFCADQARMRSWLAGLPVPGLDAALKWFFFRRSERFVFLSSSP